VNGSVAPGPETSNEAEGEGMLDKLKNQLTAAVGMSAAALVASGYLITWARLIRVDAPPRAVLPALPTVYYLGVALESLLLLMVLLLVVGVGFLFAQIGKRTRKAVDNWPSPSSWLVLGVVVAAVALLLGGGFVSSVFSTHTRALYVPAMLGVAVLVVALAAIIGVAGEQLQLRGPSATAAAILVLATAAAVGFKLTDAWLGVVAFPQASALVSESACDRPTHKYFPKDAVLAASTSARTAPGSTSSKLR
jgi:hypothetical protein